MKFASCPASLFFALMLSSSSNQSFADTYLRGINVTDPQGIATPSIQDDLVGMFIITDGGMYPEGDRLLQKGKPVHPKRTSNILLSDGTFYEVKNSKANWDERLVSGRDMIRIPRGSAKNPDGSIDMMGAEPSFVSTDASQFFDRNLQEEYTFADRTPKQDPDLAADHSDRNLQSGARTVLAVRVILNDGAYNFASQTGLSDDIFGNGVDPVNLRSQYAACSYNRLIFNKAPNRLMSSNPNDGSTAINNGVVDIRVNMNRSAGEGNILNGVTAKINSVFAVTNPNVLANHVMYCLPSGFRIGVAIIGGGLTWYSNQWCNRVSAQMHEIGHNLNFGHSNENGGYEDKTGFMGYSYDQDDQLMCFDGAKSWQTGWYASKSKVVDPSTGGCFEGNVYGISDFGNAASSTVLLKINDFSSTDHYVAFNRQSGINAGTLEAGNQVTVTRQGAEGAGYAESELVGKLSAGGTWSGAVSGKNMVVNVLSIDLASSPAFARVRISENGGSCGTVSPPSVITIQAESYLNMLGVIRENTSDVGGGQNVGHIQAGEWMSYPAVTIPISGTYRVSYRVAALYSGGSLQLERAGGSIVYGGVTIPATGGYQTWTTISHIVTLGAGNEMFGIKATGSGWNINWFTITKA